MLKIIAIVVFASLAAAPARAQAIDSAYTKHDYQKCKVVGDEDPVLETLCQGYAGIPVRWLNGPDSSSIFFGDEPAPDDTYDERFTFAVVENTVEWRGPRKAGRIAPFAAIVRFQLCRSIGGPCKPELALFRLEGKRRSCIAATLGGTRADANVKARAIADGFVRGFRCRTDQKRPPE